MTMVQSSPEISEVLFFPNFLKNIASDILANLAGPNDTCSYNFGRNVIVYSNIMYFSSRLNFSMTP